MLNVGQGRDKRRKIDAVCRYDSTIVVTTGKTLLAWAQLSLDETKLFKSSHVSAKCPFFHPAAARRKRQIGWKDYLVFAARVEVTLWQES